MVTYKKFKSRKGSAYLYVVIIFLFVTLFSAIMFSMLQQSVYQTHTYSLRMKAFYLTKEAADATVAVLLEVPEKTLANPDPKPLIKTMSYPATDTMTHTVNKTTVVGTSVITLTKEKHDYYGESKDWIVANITTTIPDERNTKPGTTTGAVYTFKGSVMILWENSMIQLYNITLD